MDCQWKVLLVDCVLALKFTHCSQSNLKTRTNHLTSDIYSILNSFGFKLSRKILFLMTLLKSQKVLKDIHTSDRFQSCSSDCAISQNKIGLQRSISYLHEEHITLIPWARGLLSPIRTSTSVRVGIQWPTEYFSNRLHSIMCGRQQGEWIEVWDELKDAEELGDHKLKEMAGGLKVTTKKGNGVNRF